MRRGRTTRYWVARALSIALITIGWGFCPPSNALAQTPKKRYEEILRDFRDTKSKPPPLSLLPLERAWTLQLRNPPSAAPAMDAERIYLPLREGLIVALYRESGVLAWIRPYETVMPVVLGGPALFFVRGDEIWALDAASGSSLWRIAAPGQVAVPLVFDNGWLLALTTSGDLHAYRASDGRRLWSRSLGVASAHAPVAGGENSVYLSLSDGRVVALAIDSGEMQWERQLTGTLSPPAAGRDRVFVGSTDNFLYALDEESGREEWRWRNGGDVIGATVEGDVVYFASLDNIIRAVNRGNGNQRWRKPTGTRPVLPPQAFNGVVLLPGLMPAITAFVGLDGTVMGAHPAEGALVGAPLVDRTAPPGQVAMVIVTREGVVDAFRPVNRMFREVAGVPLTVLPGRTLPRERLE